MCVGCLAPALAAASTFSVRVRWQPSTSPGVVGYRIYRRPAGGTNDMVLDVGSPPPASDGTLASVVTGQDTAIGYAFSVTAYRADGLESAHSNEIVIGPSGGGADLCADVVAPAPLDVDRILISSRGSVLIARLTLPALPDFDPSATGIVLEAAIPGGGLVYRATVPAAAITPNSAQTMFRYDPRLGTTLPGADGLKRLSIRRIGDGASVTAIATTPELSAAVTAAGLDVAVRAGTLCAQSLDVPCVPLSGRTTCTTGP